MKYVYHREMGTKYSSTQFEQSVETIRAFLSDHGFAKENPAQKYVFSILPKGNMLMVKGTIELFEDYQERERIAGKAIVIQAKDIDNANARSDVFIPGKHQSKPNYIFFIIKLLVIVGAILIIAYIALNYYQQQS